MWVKLLSAQQLDLDGKARTYYPGDWVEIGKQFALQLISRKLAVTAVPIQLEVDHKAGIVLSGNVASGKEVLSRWGIRVPIAEGGLELVFEKTLYWDTTVPLRVELVPAGFDFLNKWELAIPLHSYQELARDIGTEGDRVKTKGVVRDLRVPFYDQRLMFMRRCDNTVRVLKSWESFKQEIHDPRLSFLCAIYRVRPLILALPITWKGGKVR